MHYDKNEVVLLYNDRNPRDRKTLAYAHTISKKINRQELNSVRVSDTMFRILMDELKMDGKKIINKADPYYQKHIRGKELSPDDWHQVLRNRPELLRAPVAIYRGKAVVCETPTDILKIAG